MLNRPFVFGRVNYLDQMIIEGEKLENKIYERFGTRPQKKFNRRGQIEENVLI